MRTVYNAPPPLYWRDEISGLLSAAVMAYLDNRADAEQIKLLASYFHQWMKFPWRCCEEDQPEMDEFRARAPLLSSSAEVRTWLHQALDLGIDPL